MFLRARSLLALAVGAAVVVALDVARARSAVPGRWTLAEAAVLAVALLVAWRAQETLRLGPVLVVAACEQAAHAGHGGVDVAALRVPDRDRQAIFAARAVDGVPGAPLPAGAGVAVAQAHRVLHLALVADAVADLAAQRKVGGGSSVWVANASVMVVCGLVAAAAIWSCRTRWSAWLAAFVALWPVDGYVSQLRFDLAVAALLAVGLALALRERFLLAGVAFGLGAAVKWTPALAAAALAVWLVSSGRAREAARCAGSALVAFAIVTVPLLAWSPSGVVMAYRKQAVRTITGESLPYLPIHWLGLAHLRGDLANAASVPGWANAAATAAQLVLACVTRNSLRAGVTVCGLVPVVFLLGNRVFSAQFILVLLIGWAIGIALLVRTRQEQLALVTVAAAATLTNLFVSPYTLPGLEWQVSSTVLFMLSLGLTAYLLRAAFVQSRERQRARR